MQDLAKEIVNEIPDEKLNDPSILWSGRLWNSISFEKYEALRKESEYAGWLYVNGFTVNHFTVSVTHLKKLNDI